MAQVRWGGGRVNSWDTFCLGGACAHTENWMLTLLTAEHSKPKSLEDTAKRDHEEKFLVKKK